MWLIALIAMELDLVGSGLGANPDEAVVHYLGAWSIKMLLIAFSVTPIARFFRWSALRRMRRFFGLNAFVYVVLHLMAYVLLFVELDWGLLFDDLVKRTYVIVGMLSFACLLLMAITSTRNWKKRLGSRWLELHRLIYPALICSLIHYIWLTKDGYGIAVIYVLCFVVLSADRVRWYLKSNLD